MIVTEDGVVVGSVDRAKLEELQGPAEDLSKLKKDELVERAEAAGLDTSGKTKAELVEALNAPSGEVEPAEDLSTPEDDDGDDELP